MQSDAPAGVTLDCGTVQSGRRGSQRDRDGGECAHIFPYRQEGQLPFLSMGTGVCKATHLCSAKAWDVRTSTSTPVTCYKSLNILVQSLEQLTKSSVTGF